MRNNKSAWILASIIFVVAAGFTVFCGISIANMTKTREKTPETTAAPEETPAVADTESPVETLPPAETESEPAAEETTEAPTETIETPSASGSIRALSADELNSIRATYDGTVTTYYTSNDRDGANRPNYNAALEQTLKAKFPNVHLFNDAVQSSISLCFILTIEYDSNTSAAISILDQSGIKGTFFMDYNYASSHPDIVQILINNGHEIGSLGYAFPDGGLAHLSLEDQQQDILNFHNYMHDTYGYEMKKFYPGYEQYSEQSLALLTSMGYSPVFYTVNYVDYSHDEAIDPNTFLTAMINQLHDHAVYSFHTTNAASVQVLPGLISQAFNSGYQIQLIGQ